MEKYFSLQKTDGLVPPNHAKPLDKEPPFSKGDYIIPTIPVLIAFRLESPGMSSQKYRSLHKLKEGKTWPIAFGAHFGQYWKRRLPNRATVCRVLRVNAGEPFFVGVAQC
ncbi:MAG: hypothetical protein P4L55_06210 [Syntrophobacteraceae bacterium]|nr:hypothetical protein [Syntrophobacteraceae bacterium]